MKFDKYCQGSYIEGPCNNKCDNFFPKPCNFPCNHFDNFPYNNFPCNNFPCNNFPCNNFPCFKAPEHCCFRNSDCCDNLTLFLLANLIICNKRR